jgi:hypothetical protein
MKLSRKHKELHMKNLSKTRQIYNAITRNKRGLTTATIRSRFNTPNVSAIINDLRRNGLTVKSVKVQTRNGTECRWVA